MLPCEDRSLLSGTLEEIPAKFLIFGCVWDLKVRAAIKKQQAQSVIWSGPIIKLSKGASSLAEVVKLLRLGRTYKSERFESGAIEEISESFSVSAILYRRSISKI